MGIAPVTLIEPIPQRQPLEPDYTYVLTMRAEAFAIAEQAAVGVVPLPPAAPLLALGLGALALLRRRPVR